MKRPAPTSAELRRVADMVTDALAEIDRLHPVSAVQLHKVGWSEWHAARRPLFETAAAALVKLGAAVRHDAATGARISHLGVAASSTSGLPMALAAWARKAHETAKAMADRAIDEAP